MTPDDHANTVREALPSMDGHEDNCPCSVGRAHAALDALQAQAEQDAKTIAHYTRALDIAEAERDRLAARVAELEAGRPSDETLAKAMERVTRADRCEAAEARVAELEAALREIGELCDHWQLHDKTDPDEHERWRLAATRRAEMIGDRARAALATDNEQA